MKQVDFAKLSEQYASFLVAVGGVSITVLALVLSLVTPAKGFIDAGLDSFLILALIVATVCCFTGAHMMAETAAFISHAKAELMKEPRAANILPAGTPLGERLFFLASTNIFIAVSLVLFALMLLPSASALPGAAGVKRISFVIFVVVIVGALLWMCLAARFRMSARKRERAIFIGLGLGLLWGFALLGFAILGFKRLLLWLTFVPITASTVVSLAYFACRFKNSAKDIRAWRRKSKTSSGELGFWDVLIFGLVITASYASLVVAGLRTMCW